ncbi:hypothetical protein C0989_000984 [Termitomyces sp. Mn162]|nr:hypothetical protein C0989_000984 [Termitomyces sp. Mn162]
MLSAIAARKAAQAARQNPNTLEKDTISLEVPIDVLPQTKSTSKRKSSTQNLDSAKRKKNEKRKPADPPREFTEDSFRAQQGVIIIESDGESLSEGLPTPNPTTSRRWSPSIPLNDSSDEEADTISFAAPPTTVSPNNGTDTPAILSTFDSIPDQNTFFLQPTEVSSLHLEGDAPHHATVVALRPEETLCLLGTYVFSVLQGSIMFSGVTLSSSPNIYRVFAPRSAPLPVFEGIDGSGAIPHIRQLPPAIHCVISTPVALVLLQELRSGVEDDAQVRSQTKDIQVFELSVSWRRALPSISPSNDTSIHLVKGPKKSGKSTFARTLVNTLLSHAHYVGAMTPRSSPSLYLAAVQAILETYRLDIQTPAISWRTSDADTRISDSIPLVVNTMGWNKGLGADLTIKLQEMIQPTDIYEIETPFDPAWPTPAPRDVAASSHPTRTHLLRPAPASILSANYSAADHRSLSIMSYFHVIFSNSTPTADEFPQTTGLTWHTSLPLCALPPYEVDCARSFDKVILTGAGTEDVVPSEIARVLNGSLVALVSCAPGTLDLDLDSETLASRIPYTQGCEAPSPALSRCLGLALVRSVSPLEPQTQMHVLTPLPPKLLSKCRVLVKGELELPIWGMLDYREEGDEVAGVESGKVPFLQWGKGEGVGGERRRIRRNLMRRAQM